MVYQFLATIRQHDGRPFTDRNGRVTSHLIGLLYRTTSWIEQGVRPVWIFDGKPPELKAGTLRTRFLAKERAQEEWQAALAEGDLERARKKAAQTSRLTRAMTEEALQLLSALGLPAFRAPSEGEAQGARMAAAGLVWATASEDYDSLLFGAPRLVRGLGARQARRQEPAAELIDRDRMLAALGISPDELILIGLLIGTDFNDGATGYGPKKALKLVQRHLGWQETLRTAGLDPAELEPVAALFRDPEVTDSPPPEFGPPDEERLRKLLVEEHDFSPDRVAGALERIRSQRTTATASSAARARQTLLESFPSGGT